MRQQLLKGHSTSSERRFVEILNKLHIPFKAKIKIQGREIDFLLGKYAVDIDGHAQDVEKNKMLIKEGYTPIHFNSWAIPSPNLIEWLRKIYGL